MSGPTREQVIQWAHDTITLCGALGMLKTTDDDLTRFAELAYAAGQDAEREARIAAQQELAICREAMTRAEHEAQRARGELAAEVAAEREACRSIADAALNGASMSKYATSAECRAARDMAKKIEHRIRARGQQ